jgi:hypothetical protein
MYSILHGMITIKKPRKVFATSSLVRPSLLQALAGIPVTARAGAIPYRVTRLRACEVPHRTGREK